MTHSDLATSSWAGIQAAANRWWQAYRMCVLLGSIAVVTMWPVGSLTPAAGIDPSWTTGLNLARSSNLQFGDSIQFTYGPLGFALFPSLISRSGLALSLAACAMVCVLYSTSIYQALSGAPHRRRVVASIALILLAPSTGAALCDVTAVAYCLAVASIVRNRRRVSDLLLLGCAGGAALLLLMKVSTGFVALGALLLLAVSCDRRWRCMAVAMGGWVGFLLVGWLSLGQRIGALPSWLLNSWSISSGYSWSMGREELGREWERVLAVSFIAVLLIVVARRTARALRVDRAAITRARGWAPAAVTGLALFFAWKEGFVRHDIHAGLFFFAVLLLSVVRACASGRGDVSAYLAPGFWLLVLTSSGGGSVVDLFDPSPSARALATAADRLLSDRSWRASITSGREQLVAHYAVPASMLQRIGDAPVHVSPTETSAMWAYDLAWAPAPVFQTYQSYTPRLDGLGADTLSSDDGPEFVLQHVGESTDGRLQMLEAPRTNLALMCNFVAAESTVTWLLLERTAQSRCGEPEPLVDERVAAGDPVEVPLAAGPDQIVLVAIDYDRSLWDHLQAAIYKSDEYWLDVDGVRWRVLPLVSGSVGILHAATSASGWPSEFSELDAAPRRLTLDHDARVRIFSVSVDPSIR